MTSPPMATAYDFVIVGGGSAGCALANRLSADPAHSVLVLEAGRNDSRWDVFIHMPAALPFPIGSRFYDWSAQNFLCPGFALLHGFELVGQNRVVAGHGNHQPHPCLRLSLLPDSYFEVLSKK